MNEPTSNLIIETREQLLGLLAEAMEIEHCLMCCYMYAMFSLKTGDDEGLSAEELAATRRWRRVLLDVALEEMAHMTLVGNLTVGLGGGPHLVRQNFPVTPGYFPSGVVATLAPFDMDTIEHFVYLERPADADVQDSPAFPQTRIERPALRGRLSPLAQHYTTVGELYLGIQRGIEHFVASMGHEQVFVGREATQIGPTDMALPGISTVRCLKTALQAIETIVTQGEGSSITNMDSHYCRFSRVRDEYKALLARNPDFKPGRPVARNPVMRKPPIAEGRIWITHPESVQVIDFANALYGLMLRLLAQSFGRPKGQDAAKKLALDSAINVMHVLTPVAELLTRLPANESLPGVTAGISFATLRSISPMPLGRSEWLMLAERVQELCRAAEQYAVTQPVFVRTVAQLQPLAERLQNAATDPRYLYSGTPAAVAAPVMPVAKLASDFAGDEARGRDLTVRFETKRCIHARHCVLGAPQVFLANTPGEWIVPDAMPTEALVGVAHNCPSGAITYDRHDGGALESPPPVNTLNVRENGPLALRAPLLLDGEAIGYRATLCRCGASQNKPFCDGSHNTIRFAASGEPAGNEFEALAVRDGPLALTPLQNGPLQVSGNLELCSGTGRTFMKLTDCRLCRCGGSANKPFCDGTHARNGFEASGQALP